MTTFNNDILDLLGIMPIIHLKPFCRQLQKHHNLFDIRMTNTVGQRDYCERHIFHLYFIQVFCFENDGNKNTLIMVITKLKYVIIHHQVSKHIRFLTKTFNVAMIYIIKYIFVDRFCRGQWTWIYSWTSWYMEGTAIFDLPTWGGPFNPYNVTQTHSIFVKL